MPPTRPLSTRAYFAAALVLFTLLTAALTYPQITGLRDTVHDDGDPLLNAWAIAWVAHQLPRAPAHLFDANIFYPERRTLAYSETLIAPSVAVAPLLWLGAGPLLVYNIVFLAGFIVSGAGTALLVRELTGSGPAGVLAGIVFAFLPYRIDHYAHLQLQQTEFIPLALWAFHRLLATGRRKDGALLGVFTGAQLLSCMYYGIFLIPYFGVVCGALLAADRVKARRAAAGLALAVAIAGVSAVPVGRAYLGARKVVGERGVEEIAARSATWRNYLAAPYPSLLYGSTAEKFGEAERRLFPGFLAMLLAAVALWPPLSAPRAAYGLGLLVAVDLSLGFNGFAYRFLYDHLLPFRALRIPARMGVMSGFSLAVLAGFGWLRVAALARTPRRRRAAWVAIGALMLLEYASKPLDLATLPTAPPEIYADLLRDRGDAPTAIVFEFPASPKDDPTYMYWSTFHWQTLVNGYSGFFPSSYIALVSAMQDFPSDESFRQMKMHGTRYLLVHGERLFGARYEDLVRDLAQRPELALVSRRPWAHSEISLYRVVYGEK
ncbi:MAG TPA: hypothetical protein VL309_00510 [Vicinamibacterales bacterium]|jgi:hypothetical protein|nr:hypothetical protein [Vicinamibacterales bacterium]